VVYESEYKELLPNSDLSKRKEYWEVGKGLQKADGLTTSEYLETVIADTLSGKYDTQDAPKKVAEYYKQHAASDTSCRTEEADMSAARIAAYLEIDDFKFSPAMLKSIHKTIFEGALPKDWVGVWRNVNLSKDEPVLNGATVTYTDYRGIVDTLSYDFDQQENTSYSLPITQEQVHDIARFMSRIWEVHPFREGNTRTVSTFMIKYLRKNGININNEPFAEHAKWLRDALVRANYSSAELGVVSTQEYLNTFYENVLMKSDHNLAAISLKV